MDRKVRMAKLAEAHRNWVNANLESAPFNPDSRPESEDYNVWNVDMDADEAAQDAFMQETSEL